MEGRTGCWSPEARILIHRTREKKTRPLGPREQHRPPPPAREGVNPELPPEPGRSWPRAWRGRTGVGGQARALGLGRLHLCPPPPATVPQRHEACTTPEATEQGPLPAGVRVTPCATRTSPCGGETGARGAQVAWPQAGLRRGKGGGRVSTPVGTVTSFPPAAESVDARCQRKVTFVP